PAPCRKLGQSAERTSTLVCQMRAEVSLRRSPWLREPGPFLAGRLTAAFPTPWTRSGRRQDNDARLWRPLLRIHRVLHVMLHPGWSAEAWAEVRVEFRRALAVRSEIRRAAWFNQRRGCRSP